MAIDDTKAGSAAVPLDIGLSSVELVIDDDATLIELAGDFDNLFQAGLAALDSMRLAPATGDERRGGQGALSAALHSLRMADAVFIRLFAMVQKQGAKVPARKRGVRS
ncbi:MAG: hypothetical protein HY856_10785 [Burkholderiales bacterium]|jgi:hypothetical protein|nr:hypothetical protein [Burkholderiales bacterium]